MARRWKLFLIIGIITLVADIATKIWAKSALPSNGMSVEVIENFWAWRLSYNTGSAFGLFHSMTGARIFLTVVGVGALGFVIYMQHKARDDQSWLTAALAMVAGGAVGNLADRILYGKVTDFVVWKYYDKEWPTFNVADVALCVGVGILLVDSFKQSREEAKAAKEEEAEAQAEASNLPEARAVKNAGMKPRKKKKKRKSR